MTGNDAAMWEHQGDDLAERQREGPVLRNDLPSTVQGSIWCLTPLHLIRPQRPGGAQECRLWDEGVDHRTHAEAL